MPLRAFPERGHRRGHAADPSRRRRPVPATGRTMAEIAANSTRSHSTKLRSPALRQVAIHYGLATLAIALALAVRFALSSLLTAETSYLFFLPAILIGSAFGGWGPGIFATVLGLVLGLFFFADIRSISPADARQRGDIHASSASAPRGAASCCIALALPRRRMPTRPPRARLILNPFSTPSPRP